MSNEPKLCFSYCLMYTVQMDGVGRLTNRAVMCWNLYGEVGNDGCFGTCTIRSERMIMWSLRDQVGRDTSGIGTCLLKSGTYIS